MTVRVDQPRHQMAAFTVIAVGQAFLGALVPFRQQRLYMAVVADHDAGKADDLAICVDREAVDIVDQPVGQDGRGGGHQASRKGCCCKTRHFHRFSLRISELVSCRAPPIACTSA